MQRRVNSAIPACAGIALRAPHFQAVLEQMPDVGWFEAHSENYFGLSGSISMQAGGAPLHYLERIREYYPISLHGVGLSLGSVDPLNQQHLQKLKNLIQRVEPGLVSEHLSWSSVGGNYFNDLLPLPYTEEALAHIVNRISATQDFLGRRILIENASSYLEFSSSTIPEWEFIVALAQQADCKILLDVNNIYVNAMNHGFDPLLFLKSVPVGLVAEIHLAGHTVKTFGEGMLRIDTHDQLVCDAVWQLYEAAVGLFPDVPALIEWDSNLPVLNVLLDEAQRADNIVSAATGCASPVMKEAAVSSLHEQQRAFSEFIMAVGTATQPDAGTLALKQSATNQFSDSQRLQIYRNNSAISLRDALAGVYPVVQRLVGENFFQYVAREYIQRHPSRSGNLHDFGNRFPHFLDSFPGMEALPYLPDVARLEWVYHQVFHVPENSVLNLAALAALNEMQIAALTFQVSASCCLLASAYPILRIWQANQPGQESQSVSLDEGGLQVVVVRHAQQVEFHLLTAGVFALLEALAEKQTFAHACDAALLADPGCDVGAALQLLVKQRMVSGFALAPADVVSDIPNSGETDEHINGQYMAE